MARHAETAELKKTAHLDAEADEVWSGIGRFGAIASWHPYLARSESNGERPGALRKAHAADGSVQIERLTHADGVAHIHRYEMAATPMPVENYAAEMRVDDRGDGTSDFVWSVRFDVVGAGSQSAEESEVVDRIDGFLEAGVEALRQRYGEAA